MVVKARYIAPVGRPVIESGSVEIRDGCIVAVGPAHELSGGPLIDYENAVIVPGFVNAHTHLELSHLRGRVPPGPDLIDWLQRLMAIQKAEAPLRAQVQQAVRQGIAESLSHGVTAIGDITRHLSWSRTVLADSQVRAVSFAEVVSIGRRRWRNVESSTRCDGSVENGAMVQQEREEARRLPPFVPSSPRPFLRLGISPHAPYSVEPEVLRACADQARVGGLPICIHLLESPHEDAFTRKREGPLAEYLRSLGVWDDRIPTSGCGPVELLEVYGLLGPTTILAHVNYAADADIARIAATGAHVTYCPRTHQAFGHPRHRFREMLAAGINVCIGTDSLASNPTLSVLDELRCIRRAHPDLSSDELIELGTIRGARALGLDGSCGSLAAGKCADLAVLPLAAAQVNDWSSIFDSDDPPMEVFFAGMQNSARGAK